MKITRDSLLASDMNTLFTRDPNTFFEAILINILWDKTAASIDHDLIARQRAVFERWFKYFEGNMRIDIEKELGLAKARQTADYQTGHIAGQIHALTNLPLRNGALGKNVDLTKVAAELKRLKAIEPRGVISNEEKSINNF